MYMCEKSRILVYTFLVSCDSRIEPISETTIFDFFPRWYSKYFLFSPVILKILSDHFSKISSNGRHNFLYYSLKYCEVLFKKIEEKNNTCNLCVLYEKR